MKRKVLTVKEVAWELAVHEETVRRWARNGKIKGMRIGGQWFFSKKVINQVLWKS